MADYDDLPFRQFTSKSEADKAINSLKGILIGINIDGKVNDAEMQELNNWCGKHLNLINRNPFQEFMQTIQAALVDPSNREELITDLYWLCQKYEGDSYYYNVATTDLQTLQGICHGILADGIVTDEEVVAFNKWLEDNTHLATYYPYDELRSVVLSALEDGKIDEDERRHLTAHFKEFVNLTDENLTEKIKSSIGDSTITGICTKNPQISISSKSFCFTGVSVKAKRSDIEKKVKSLGGIFNSNVTKTTDYLIIGDGGNPCWAYACYGRKVESAVILRKQGHRILLVNEGDFWKHVDNV